MSLISELQVLNASHPRWLADSAAAACMRCNRPFTLVHRRCVLLGRHFFKRQAGIEVDKLCSQYFLCKIAADTAGMMSHGLDQTQHCFFFHCTALHFLPVSPLYSPFSRQLLFFILAS